MSDSPVYQITKGLMAHQVMTTTGCSPETAVESVEATIGQVGALEPSTMNALAVVIESCNKAERVMARGLPRKESSDG